MAARRPPKQPPGRDGQPAEDAAPEARSEPEQPAARSDGEQPSPSSPSVDELATVLRAVVMVGIDHATPATVGAMSGLRCVRDRARDTSDDAQTAAARDVITAALGSLGDGNYGRAARLLFGATDDTRGQPARERRRLAAYQIDVMPDWFRRRYEPQITADVAAEVLNIEHATTTEEPDHGDDGAAGTAVVVIGDDAPGTALAPTEGDGRSPVGRRVHRVLTRVRHPLTADPSGDGSPVVLASTPHALPAAQPRQLVGVLRGLRDQQARHAWHLLWIAGGVVVGIRYGRDALPRYVLVLAALGLAKTAADMFRQWRATRSLAFGESWPRLVLFAGAVVLAAGYDVGQDDNDNGGASGITDCVLNPDLACSETDTTADPHPSPYYVPPTYADPPTQASEPVCPPAAGNGERRLAFDGLPPFCINRDHRYTATIRTNYGHFTVTLNTRAAPWTVNNFVYLARWGFYDGVQLIPSPTPTEPEPLPTEVWTHLLSGHPVDPDGQSVTTTTNDPSDVDVPGYSMSFEAHQGAYPDDDTLYLVMVNTGQPDQFAVIVTPDAHEQIAEAGGTYPLLGVVEPTCRDVIAQRDVTGGWDVGPKSEPIVIEAVTIAEEPATTTTTTRPPSSDDPCGRLAAARDNEEREQGA